MDITRLALREYARWRLDSHADNALLTSDATMFDLNDALAKAYVQYARVCKAYPVEYTRASIASRGEYHYSYFGAQSLDVDKVAVSAAANNTTALTIADNPDQLSPVSITITNGTGAPATGNASTYTIVGYGRGYMPVTDTVSFVVLTHLTSVGAGASVTLSSTKHFAEVTSITPSAAQPASWTHSAGVPASTPGERIFELDHVEYNDTIIQPGSVHDLNKYMSTWRTASAGTPSHWIPWGAQSIRLWRPPSGTDNIGVYGWELPDTGAFASDTAEPDCSETDAYDVIALWVCVLATTKFPTDENMLRQSIFYPEWQENARKAFKRIHQSGDNSFIFGKHGGIPAFQGFTYEPTVTNLT